MTSTVGAKVSGPPTPTIGEMKRAGFPSMLPAESTGDGLSITVIDRHHQDLNLS